MELIIVVLSVLCFQLNVFEGKSFHKCTVPKTGIVRSETALLSQPVSLNDIAKDGLSSMSTSFLKLLAISTIIPKIVHAEIIDNYQIDLNLQTPKVTDICWMDISIDSKPSKRIEISLFGDIVPFTAANFKSLCLNENNIGYKNSDIFRIISTFSIQGGNIGSPIDIQPSKISRFGLAASKEHEPFPAENYRLLHSYRNAGVVSMMKDVTNKSLQDSRFFITLSPAAGWADDKYVAFGLVTKGMDDVVNDITKLEVVPPSNHPTLRVAIVDSGCY